MGANDQAFSCMGQKEDAAGLPGVFLEPCVVAVAGAALARNLRSLGALVLPLSEKVCAPACCELPWPLVEPACSQLCLAGSFRPDSAGRGKLLHSRPRKDG